MAPILPPGQIPAPLPPWAKLLLQLLPFLPPVQQSVLDYLAELFTSDSEDATAWCHVQVVWEHVGNIDPADRFVHTFDVVNITDGAIDSTWTQNDLNDVATHLSSFVTELLPHYAGTIRCKEFRHYIRYFNPIVPEADRGPDWKDDPYGNAGAPVFVHPVNLPGTSPAQMLADQSAVSITEKTAYPRHWGRTYLPAPTVTAMVSNGYFSSTFVNAIADAAENLYNRWATEDLFAVVPVVQVEKQPFRGLLQVNQIQVDNIPDVIRRRRPKNTTLRVVRP